MNSTDYMALTDIELVRKTHEPDHRALEVLMERYKPIVIQKTQGYFLANGSRDDIVQEGMIGLYMAILSFDPAKSDAFFPYATICITRQIISAIRKAESKKHSMLNASLPFETDDTLSDNKHSVDPMSYVLGRETLDVIMQTISGDLSQLEADVLRLRLEGKSLGEIADALGRSKKTVDNALQRMKRKVGRKVGG